MKHGCIESSAADPMSKY